MTLIINYDWRGMSYDEIDRCFHEISGIPFDKPFVDLPRHVFRGTVPTNSNSKVFDAIEFALSKFSYPLGRSEIENKFRYFRLKSTLHEMFPTNKPLHGRYSFDRILFDVSAYDEDTHKANIELMKYLAQIWENGANSIHIYSVQKDCHSTSGLNSRNAATPFVRNYIAFIVIVMN